MQPLHLFANLYKVLPDATYAKAICFERPFNPFAPGRRPAQNNRPIEHVGMPIVLISAGRYQQMEADLMRFRLDRFRNFEASAPEAYAWIVRLEKENKELKDKLAVANADAKRFADGVIEGERRCQEQFAAKVKSMFGLND